MKLRALRVAAFRRFAAPVAIDGIRDGVNVLAGPNEMGKSTLFHALEAAFLMRFKAGGAALDHMRPHVGGEPLVEVDFERDGRVWRLRKQFGRGANAILSDATTGRIEARNGDAEDRLVSIVRGHRDAAVDLGGMLGLVWVRQQRSFSRPDPDFDPKTDKQKSRGIEYTALMDAVTAEVDATVSGELFEAVRRRTTDALGALVTTERSAARKGGPLDKAQSALADASAKLADAQRAAAAAHDRGDAIVKLDVDLALCNAPGAAALAAATISKLDAEIANAVSARGRRDLAMEKLRALEREALWAEKSAREAAERAIELERLGAALSQAEIIEQELKTLAEKANANPATVAVVQSIVDLQNDLTVLGAQIAVQSALVDIDVTEAGRGRVRVDGTPISENRSLSVADQLTIDLDGLAAVRIRLPNASKAAALKREYDSKSRQLADRLAALDVSTLDEARGKSAARTATLSALEACRLQQAALAPQGIARLADRIAALQAEQTAAADGSTTSPLPAATSLAARRDAIIEAQAALTSAATAALDDTAYKALVVVRQTAAETEARRAERVADLTVRRARLSGEQSGADEDGRAASVDALAGVVTRAGAEVARFTNEVAALQLLEATLRDVEAASRDAVFAPVVRRLAPHLARMFGAADLAFKDQFAVDQLTRNGVREAVATLSDGTREQLSVLVRLSFAEVLAERGHALPLVLDDPLVFSDDERLRQMLDVLANAPAIGQMLVLTCRESAFRALAGERLRVQAWQPEVGQPTIG